MPNCSICYDRFTDPVSLPCGHVFCRECIRRTVDSTKPTSIQHFCPTCRASYSVLTVDPGPIPPYLRPHILPPIRQVFFDDSAPSASGSTCSPAELERVVADANALRMDCATWRRRAETHAAANTGLLGFARAAKEHALRMRAERDGARTQCALLKRKLAELMSESDTCVPEVAAVPPPRVGLPVFLMQCKAAAQFYDNPADMTESHFGPPIKRRRKEELPCDSIFVSAASVPGAVVGAAVTAICDVSGAAAKKSIISSAETTKPLAEATKVEVQ
ncbi:hypothetical protein C8R43DRAFT_1005437 [Mycena crocata]|nr:hypothetical protein C8R43DRAFT_1005437 [Mycena crocata]